MYLCHFVVNKLISYGNDMYVIHIISITDQFIHYKVTQVHAMK